MARLTRRAFLIVATVLAPASEAAARQAAAPAGVISRDAFMRLSQRLVGNQHLDAETGAIYLDALLAVPENGPLLARLARPSGGDLDATHTALERTIVEWWYTGIYTLHGERRVATHAGALMWSASGVSAPGACALAFGAWARPPQPA